MLLRSGIDNTRVCIQDGGGAVVIEDIATAMEEVRRKM